MNLLILDNYDSFTYNLVQMVRELSRNVAHVLHFEVRRNDRITLEACSDFDKIIFSPGPGIPNEAGIMKEIIKEYAGAKSMLGICLGHQAIAEVFNGTIYNLENVHHGVATDIQIIADDYLLAGLPSTLKAGRYHSWAVHSEIPDCLETLAVDHNGEIMALRHKEFDIRGVQFHPESILTPDGEVIISNFICK